MKQSTKYTDAIKAGFVSKALSPNAPSVIELAKEFNIPNSIEIDNIDWENPPF